MQNMWLPEEEAEEVEDVVSRGDGRDLSWAVFFYGNIYKEYNVQKIIIRPIINRTQPKIFTILFIFLLYHSLTRIEISTYFVKMLIM